MLWRALSAGTAVVLNILFARYFAASESGRMFYLFTLFAFIIQVSSLSLESGMGYYAAKNDTDDRHLVGFSLAWSFLSTIVTIALFAPVAQLSSLKINYPLAYPACYLSGNMLIAFGNAFCYSKYRFVLPGIVAAMVNIFLIMLLLNVEYSGTKEYFISIYFYSFLVHGMLLFLFILLQNKILPSFSISSGNIKNIFRYSWYAFMGNMIFLFMCRVDYFFVKHYCSPGELGNYIQVSRISQVFFIFPSMVSSVLFPVIAVGLKPAIAERVRIISVLILILSSAALLVLAVTGRFLFPLFYGNSFDRMFMPYLLLMPGIMAISSLYPYTAYFSASNRLSVNIRGSFIALTVIVTGDALFIPVHGINAAALVSSAGYVVFQLYVLSVFSKESGVPYRKLFTLNRMECLYIINRFKW